MGTRDALAGPSRTDDSPWIRPPKQARARRTIERVLDAGAALLADAGYEGLSIVEVCRRAGVSPGTLYSRVANKGALFMAILEKQLTRITDDSRSAFAVSEEWQRYPTPMLVTNVVHTLGSQYRNEERLLRAFILRSAVDDRAREIGSRYSAITVEAAENLLLTRRDDYPHADPVTAVRTAFRITADTLSWRTAFGADFAAPGADPDPHWLDRLAEVCRGYLLTPPHVALST